jgi:hypothetical protein
MLFDDDGTQNHHGHNLSDGVSRPTGRLPAENLNWLKRLLNSNENIPTTLKSKPHNIVE